ncbi:hypothetical protein IFM89_023334 [Coptis chinensis]|uniref:Uncharacterized protein n=1 Tax=Coptis chinensis TaxID=261450 RepID=A0A835HPG7_9MAGN|nr:hypothetical protein IFM89_023334 [Coptis chinensis]
MAYLHRISFTLPLLIGYSLINECRLCRSQLALLETTLPEIPELPKPTLPTIPTIPSMPKPELPTLPKPELPSLPQIPTLPKPELPPLPKAELPPLPKTMSPKRATTSKALMVDEASTSQAASKNADRRTRRSVSRLVEEVNLKDLLRRMAELEKQNQMLMAENKAVREEKEKRAEDAMYEKDDEESSSEAKQRDKTKEHRGTTKQHHVTTIHTKCDSRNQRHHMTHSKEVR